MGVGSQRVPSSIRSRRPPSRCAALRGYFVVANLGAVQLNYGYGIDECRKAVEMIEADALILHLNPVQEAVQKGGSNFAGLGKKIEEICRKMEVPVIAKEWAGASRNERRGCWRIAECSAIGRSRRGRDFMVASGRHAHRTSSRTKLAAAFVGWASERGGRRS